MTVHRTDDRLVAGRYARKERIGHGGFGVVWRAHDTLLQRDVAVKEIEFPGILDEDERARLRDKVLREARAAARLNHPGLVTVFDVVEEDGGGLIVMELVDAPTLADLVERQGPLGDREAAAVGAEMLDALGAAHDEGIVHRDVKPGNVMVHTNGRVQLADFGIAAIIDDPKVTSSGQLAGSPSYMAPEQAQNAPAGPATDLWGLGATLYYAVEGRPPFEKPGAIATLTSVVNDDPRPMERATAIAPLLRDLLAKDPLQRPPVEDVRRRLDDLANGVPVEATPTVEFEAPVLPVTPPPEPPPTPVPVSAPPPPVSRPAVSPPPVSRPAVSPPPEPSSRGPVPPRPQAAAVSRRARPTRPRWATALALAVLLVAVGVASVLALRPNPSTPTGEDTTETTDSTATPEGWVSYQDPTTGFTIAHPEGWTVRTSGTLTDFRDPVTRAYLRVDHRQPPGPSPEGAWLSLEPRFAADYPTYQRIRIAPTRYEGYPAAQWEYTYSDGGAALHAVNLGFVTGEYGFALNFQTHAEDWERLQPIFEQFKKQFKAPA